MLHFRNYLLNTLQLNHIEMDKPNKWMEKQILLLWQMEKEEYYSIEILVINCIYSFIVAAVNNDDNLEFLSGISFCLFYYRNSNVV